MLAFRPMAQEDRSLLEEYFDRAQFESSELTYPDLYVWADTWQVHICEVEQTLYIQEKLENRAPFWLPILPLREPLEVALERAVEYSRAQGYPFLMRSVDEAYRTRMARALPGRFQLCRNDEYDDYIYEAKALATLEGKKLHPKRTQRNKFVTEFAGRFAFQPLAAEHAEPALELFDLWLKNKPLPEQYTLLAERKATERALRSLKELELTGGTIWIDGKLVAYSIVEVRKERAMAITHFEKADAEIPGLYVMINHLTAEMLKDRVLWINREEDMGIEGLRSAKRSWNPARMIEKYIATLE